MPSLRRPKKTRPPTSIEVVDLRASLQLCADKIAALEREIDINIKRMGAMQAEIDHLRALLSRTS